MNVLVTGASSGIGRALSIEFCREGGKVLGVGRSVERLEEIKNAYNNCFDYLVLDLSDVRSVRSVVAEVARRFEVLDVLVNNVGYGL